MELINTKLMGHWMNWIVVFMMLFIAAMAGQQFMALIGKIPAQS